MASCTPLTVTTETAADLTLTAADGATPSFLGNNAGVALSAGDVTCCAEAVATVGVKYNAQWTHDGSVQYNATVN